MLELIVMCVLFIGAIYLLSEGGDTKYSKDYGPFEQPKKKHRVPLSKVRFVRKRRA